MWFLVYWYNKQLCNLKCLISLDASTIWQFGKDGTGNLFNFLQESKIMWLKFSIQVYQAYECHKVHHPSKFGEDKTSKISYIRNAPESWIICQCQGNSKSFPFYLFGQKFSTVCPFVNRSNYAYAFRKCLWLIQSEFRRPKFCRIVQILTGTEIS